MIHYPTETEARDAVERALKRFPGARVDEIHIDSATSHDWYLMVLAPPDVDGNRRVLLRCKWSSPIIKFQ